MHPCGFARGGENVGGCDIVGVIIDRHMSLDLRTNGWKSWSLLCGECVLAAESTVGGMAIRQGKVINRDKGGLVGFVPGEEINLLTVNAHTLVGLVMGQSGQVAPQLAFAIDGIDAGVKHPFQHSGGGRPAPSVALAGSLVCVGSAGELNHARHLSKGGRTKTGRR